MIGKFISRWALIALFVASALAACSQQEIPNQDRSEPGFIDLSLGFDGLASAIGTATQMAPAGVPVGSTPDYIIVRVYNQDVFDAHITTLGTVPLTVEPARIGFTAQSVQSELGGTTMFVLAPGDNLKLSVRQHTIATPNPLTIVVNVVDAASLPVATPQGSFPSGTSRLAYGALPITPTETNSLLVPVRAIADAAAADAELSPRLPVAFVYPGVTYDYLLRIRSETVASSNSRFVLPFGDLNNVTYTVSVGAGAADLTASPVGVRATVNASTDTNFTVRATADALVAAGQNGDFALEKSLEVTAVGIPYGAGGLNFDTVPPTITNLSFNNATRELSGTALDSQTGIARLRVYEGAALLASTDVAEAIDSVALVTFTVNGNFGTGPLNLAATADRYDLDVIAVDLANNQAAETLRVGPIGELPGADSVYYVAKTGNDGNAGTFAAPWFTISKAVTALGAADQNVFVGAGTYTETITIPSGIHVIDGQTKATRVINGDVTITGDLTNVTLKNLTINGNLSVGAPGTPVASFVMQNVDVTGSITIVPTSQISTASAPLNGTAFFCAESGSLSGSVTNLTLCTEANLTVENFTVEEEITFVDSNGTPTTTPPANVTFTNITAPSASLSALLDPANVWVGAAESGVTGQLGSFNNPYASIAAGITGVTSGGTVNVKAGTYNTTVIISKSVNLRGPNADIEVNGARVAPANVTGTGGGNLGAAFRVDAGNVNVTIAGFDLPFVTGQSGLRGILIGNTAAVSGSITIANNVISGWTTGISLAGGGSVGWVDNVAITGNQFVNNGIGSTENATNLTIQNNKFDNSGIGLGSGASLKAPLSGNVFTSTNTTLRYVSIASGVTLNGQIISNMLESNTFDKGVSVDSATGSWFAQAIYASLGSAVAGAAPSATLQALSGTYDGFVDIDKPLTIRGANFGVNPNTGNRAAESIITYGGDYAVEIFSSNVTFDGFTVNNTLGNAVRISVGRQNPSGPASVANVTVSNNIATGRAILSCPDCTGLWMGVLSFDNFEVDTYTSSGIRFLHNRITISDDNGRGITMAAYNGSQLTGINQIIGNHIITQAGSSVVGIELRSSSAAPSMQDVAVTANNISGTDYAGVWVRGHATAVLAENIFTDNSCNVRGPSNSCPHP
jgi:hypothetical protein